MSNACPIGQAEVERFLLRDRFLLPDLLLGNLLFEWHTGRGADHLLVKCFPLGLEAREFLFLPLCTEDLSFFTGQTTFLLRAFSYGLESRLLLGPSKSGW